MSRMDAGLAMVRSYAAGPLYETWRSRQDAGLWPSELALIQTHCPEKKSAICTVGCGAGREAIALYRLQYADLCGIDSSERLLAAARDRCGAEGMSIRFELSGAERLPLAEASIDAITMFENIYGHITPHDVRLRALAEARRVLRPGGKVLMTVTSLRHRRLYELYFAALGQARRVYNPAGMEPGDKVLNRKEWPSGVTRLTAPRTHWFEPDEIPADAAVVGLSVVQRTTTDAVVSAPTQDSLTYRGAGRLVYVLGRP